MNIIQTDNHHLLACHAKTPKVFQNVIFFRKFLFFHTGPVVDETLYHSCKKFLVKDTLIFKWMTPKNVLSSKTFARQFIILQINIHFTYKSCFFFCEQTLKHLLFSLLFSFQQRQKKHIQSRKIKCSCVKLFHIISTTQLSVSIPRWNTSVTFWPLCLPIWGDLSLFSVHVSPVSESGQGGEDEGSLTLWSISGSQADVAMTDISTHLILGQAKRKSSALIWFSHTTHRDKLTF